MPELKQWTRSRTSFFPKPNKSTCKIFNRTKLKQTKIWLSTQFNLDKNWNYKGLRAAIRKGGGNCEREGGRLQWSEGCKKQSWANLWYNGGDTEVGAGERMEWEKWVKGVAVSEGKGAIINIHCCCTQKNGSLNHNVFNMDVTISNEVLLFCSIILFGWGVYVATRPN